jgi:hypothetical protein
VDFWRKPPPLIGFGVERHTLAHRRYHPGISPYFSRISIAECATQPVRAQVSLRVWRAARDPYPDCSFLPTHLRSSQGASIEPSIVRFWRWNLADRLIQPFRAQLFQIDIWCCMQSFRADPDKSFRPISLFGEMIVLSHIAADSLVESFGVHPVLQEVRKPPRGPDPVPQRPDSRSDTHPFQSRGQGASFGVVSSVFRRFELPDEFSSWYRLPYFAGNRIFSSIYPCMHQICYHLLITGIFMLFDCIPILIHEIWLTFIFYISSRLLYFHA